MTRGNARELAVHLIYGREFTGEEPQQVVSVRLNKEYYPELYEKVKLHIPDEKARRVGQSVAAASLPKIR